MNSQIITAGSINNSVNQGPPLEKGSNVTQGDRMSLTIFFALAIHAIIILGISFDLIDNNDDIITTMEITLVHQKSDETPEEADYLAQANQLGGGKQQEKSRPSSPFSNPVPNQGQGFAPNSKQAMSLPPIKKNEKQQEVLTAENARQKVNSQPLKEETPIKTNTLKAAQLFEQSQQIEKLSAEINKLKEAFQQTPKHTWVHGANAKQYRFASYMDAWRARVEEYGNRHYPAELARQKITGSLLLDVAINPDGSIHSTRIIRPSGHTELDRAALRIVQQAAKYPPLTKEILKDTDILHIPRLWRFSSNSRLQTSVQ